VTGHRPLLHEAAEEGRIAGFNAVQDSPVEFRRRTPLTIVFSEPNIATVGTSWSELEHGAVAIGEVKIGLVGRALIMGKNRGILRLYASKSDGRILGATLVMAKGEHIAHLLGWAIEQDLTVWDLLKMPFYHPTIEEALQAALYDLAGKLERSSPEPVELRRLNR
jgi:dihydrolipoamide dehydrogenase